MAEEAPLPAGWSVISHQSAARPDEFWYYNRITRKTVRVLERPTEPPPTGVELLRERSNKSGWVGVSAVGKKTIKWQAKWHCSVLGRQRVLHDPQDTPEQAAQLLFDFIEAGAVFDAPLRHNQHARGTKPPPQKKARVEEETKAPSETSEAPLPSVAGRGTVAAGTAIKNSVMAAFFTRKPSPVAPPTIDAGRMAAFMAMDGSGEVAPAAIEPLD
jgi:hypothetical protein